MFQMFIVLALLFGISLAIHQQPLSTTNSTKTALQYLSNFPLIDGHNDLPWQLRSQFNNSLASINLRVHQQSLQTDLPRLRKGHVGGQFWSIFVPCRKFTYFDTSVRDALEQIDLVVRLVKAYPDDFEMAYTANDVDTVFKKGKIASMMGLEGGHMVDMSLGTLRIMFQMGVRYMTLTHSCNTAFADSATDDPIHHGLSEFGERLVLEMNRLGMLVDIAHVSATTMRRVLNIARAPVIFSHSSAFSVCNVSRNVPDDVLERIRELDGVVMVNFYRGFVRCKPGKATLQDVADHVMHIARVAGLKHVAFGGDFDGVDELPVGLEDVSKYPDLIAYLLDSGFPEEHLPGILGQNLLRVWRRAEEVAQNLQSRLGIIEDVERIQKTCKA